MNEQDSNRHGDQEHGRKEKEKDPRDNPIEQTVVVQDPDTEPVPVGNPPKPPYGDPPGGGGGQQGNQGDHHGQK